MASRDISPLEIILTEAPLVFCPDDLLTSCLVCGAEGAERCDQGCGHIVCGDHGEEHRGECRVLARCREQGVTVDQDSILLLRMLRIRENGGPDWEQIGQFVNEVTRRYPDLILEKMKHHSEDLIRSHGEDWSPFPKDFVEIVKGISVDDLTPEILRTFFGKIQINSVNGEEGKGLYKSMALINHSCVANSVYTFSNNNIVLRANR